jgi:hypothetical protein
MSTTHTPRSTASKVNMPGFTAECVLSVTGRGDRVSGLPRGERGMTASGVRVAVARGGGRGGPKFLVRRNDGNMQLSRWSLSEVILSFT